MRPVALDGDTRGARPALESSARLDASAEKIDEEEEKGFKKKKMHSN